jgi:hypothetical protein
MVTISRRSTRARSRDPRGRRGGAGGPGHRPGVAAVGRRWADIDPGGAGVAPCPGRSERSTTPLSGASLIIRIHEMSGEYRRPPLTARCKTLLEDDAIPGPGSSSPEATFVRTAGRSETPTDDSPRQIILSSSSAGWAPTRCRRRSAGPRDGEPCSVRDCRRKDAAKEMGPPRSRSSAPRDGTNHRGIVRN